MNSATYASTFRAYFHMVSKAMSVTVLDPLPVTAFDATSVTVYDGVSRIVGHDF
jgi:hypothetical protein